MVHCCNILGSFLINKKFDIRIFGGFGFFPEYVRGELTVATVKRGVSQILYPKRGLVYFTINVRVKPLVAETPENPIYQKIL